MTVESGELSIREMKPGEGGEVIGLVEETFGRTSVPAAVEARFGAINGRSWREVMGDVARGCLDECDVVLVGEVGGRPVAMATLDYNRKYSRGHVGLLAVAEDHQGRGIGREMVRAALSRMRDDRLRYAAIETLSKNERAARLYESEGFEEVGRQIQYFQVL